MSTRSDESTSLTTRYEQLLNAAAGARKHACAQFSGFMVGAALLSVDGKIYTGVNVESSSAGGTICAERTAMVKALSEGERAFSAIAIYTLALVPVMPCGICRQLLHDYAPEITVISGNATGQILLSSLPELLPEPFDRSAFNADA